MASPIRDLIPSNDHPEGFPQEYLHHDGSVMTRKIPVQGAADRVLCATMENAGNPTRRQKRKEMKKIKRKQQRQEIAEKEKMEEQMLLQDPVEHLKMRLHEQEEAEAREQQQLEHEEQERLWLQREKEAQEAAERRRINEEEERKIQKEIDPKRDDEGGEWEYLEEGPAEIIWQGNEIIVRKRRVKVPKPLHIAANPSDDSNRPTSNPLPPQGSAFAEHNKLLGSNPLSTVYDAIDQSPNFGTEQDKTHCPFHIKTGVCRFGVRCSRAHVDAFTTYCCGSWTAPLF